MNCSSYHHENTKDSPQNHPVAIAEREAIQVYERKCEQGDAIACAIESLERTHERIRNLNPKKETP